jgi:hypothetical protein
MTTPTKTTHITVCDELEKPYISYHLVTRGKEIIVFGCRKGNAFFRGRLVNKTYSFYAEDERTFTLPPSILKKFQAKGKLLE